MEHNSDNKKGSFPKFLAIAGFIVVIIIISWVAIRLVDVMPSAFSSLASIAESLNEESSSDEKKVSSSLTVTSDSTWVNSGEVVNISWGQARAQGTYTFSYTCTDGVNIDIKDSDGKLRNIDCETNYNLGNTDSLSIVVESEKERFKNVKYSVSFLNTDDDTPTASGSAVFTVINSGIQDILAVDDEEVSEIVETTTDVEEPEVKNPEPVSDDEPVTPATPAYQQEFIYTIPTSDPNGRTDLSTRFLSTGNIVGNTFFSGTMVQNESGAIQFEVINHGTKTSNDWTYKVSLPNGGEYESNEQKPLKPNEKAVITVGFPTTKDSLYTFKVSVDVSSDQNSLNDRFSETVVFLK